MTSQTETAQKTEETNSSSLNDDPPTEEDSNNNNSTLKKNFKNLTISPPPPKDDDMKCQCPHYFNTESTADPLLCSGNIPLTVKNVSPDSCCTYGTHYPNRIFVGHLPGKTNATDLADFFRPFGTVLEGKVVLDSFGRSRRFGFVTFATQEDVQKVLSKCPFFFKGKKINVGPAVKKMFGAEFSPPTSPGAVTGDSGSLTSESSETTEQKPDAIITVPPVNEPKDPASPNTPKNGNVWLKVNAKPKMSPKKEGGNNNNKPVYIPAPHHFVYPTTSSPAAVSLPQSPSPQHLNPYQGGGVQFFYHQQLQPVYTSNSQQQTTFPYQGGYYAQSPIPYYENGQAYFLKPVAHYGVPPPMYIPGSLTVA